MDCNAADFADMLPTHMQSVRPIDTKHNQAMFLKNYVDLKFATATKVLLKNEAKKGLQVNYIGPFKVLAINENQYVIQRGKIAETVAMHRLKACIELEESLPKLVVQPELIKHSTITYSKGNLKQIQSFLSKPNNTPVVRTQSGIVSVPTNRC